MRKNHAEIIMILDRSGSMASLAGDVVGGFNAFLKNQKEIRGTASATLILFDDQYEVVYSNKDIQKVEDLTVNTFIPRGSTALLDSVGRTIEDVNRRLISTPDIDKPEKILVCIYTDGFENASTKYNNSQIKEMIDAQRNTHFWEFVFLGSNVDSFAVAGNIGINAAYTSNFVSTAKGTRDAYATLNCYATQYRTSESN